MKRFIPTKDAMDKGRFDAFTDGVFAVAITLMVLEIHVPELKHGTERRDARVHRRPRRAAAHLRAQLRDGGLIWLNHHATFAPVKRVDRTTNALNIVLLAVVCFLPFPTALLSRYGPLPSSTALYGATFTAMSIAYFAVWQYAVRSDPEAPPVSRSVMVSGGIGTFFYAAGR